MDLQNGKFCTVPVTPVMAKNGDLIEVSFYLTLESSVAQVPWLASVLHRVQSLRSLLESQVSGRAVEYVGLTYVSNMFIVQ